MIDIKLIRENRELVKENIKKKFQDQKLPLVDEVYELDIKVREVQTKADNLKAEKNKLSAEIGKLMQAGQRDEAEKIKMQIANDGSEISKLEEEQEELTKRIKEIMMTIPNIIADDVPIGRTDAENVEEKTFGEAKVPSFEIPYHSDIMASFDGLDKDAAGRVSGNGFYYLMGDIARLHSAVLAYARDFMIDKGFTYCIPPFMIHSDAVDGVMSFAEKENMMYKIEGEDLYLIGTSEHSMIAKFKDQILNEKELPITMTSYSPCFRKEVGAHGIEERGVYRIHQFEKQEMVVLCKKEDSEAWYDKMWNYSVELFRTLDIPVRKLVCCSGDLADLKYRSCDIEAWSPRQKKYFEVCSCSNLTDAQARRLAIRVKLDNGEKEFVHTLNNTVIAPPRMLIAFLENNYNEDGSVNIPKVLRPYMGGKEKLIPTKR
jgi:seryl-tRNA synthetase